MKVFITAIAITSTLFVTQGCTPQVKSGKALLSDSAIAQENSHGAHDMGESEMPGMSHHMHGSLESANTIAKLSIQGNVTPKTPVPLVIDVHDKNGDAIASFDTFQEKLMHLIVVSDDLQFFNHIHPTYKGNGRFEIQANFPQPGHYTLFSDYKPTGKAEQVSVLKAQVPGQPQLIQKIDWTCTKTFGDTKADLAFSQPTLKAGQEVMLIFHLNQANNNQPVKDLQPYLGELGHLVILKQTSPLTRTDYIHAHAMKNSPPGQIHFMTSFPQPGNYKLWGQFNRNGRIVTTNFWVNVH
jgi:hypothetical protein